MREILFRGKQRYNGKWIISGNVFFDEELKHVYFRNPNNDPAEKAYVCREVIPESVGQYTGLTDKNGKKIFEGDIVKHFNNSDEEYDIGVIYFDTEFMGWRRTTQGRFHKIIIDTYKLNPTCIYEVIGNIHDNPELLKEGADNG